MVMLDCGLSILRSQSRKMNMPLCQRLLQKLLRDVVQALERLGGDDDELHRQAEAARQRRRLERGDPHAGDLAELLLDHRLQRIGGLRALVPGLEHHAGDRLAGHVELEHVLGFRMRGEDLVDLARIELALLQRGVRRRDRLGDDDALVLLSAPARSWRWRTGNRCCPARSAANTSVTGSVFRLPCSHRS